MLKRFNSSRQNYGRDLHRILQESYSFHWNWCSHYVYVFGIQVRLGLRCFLNNIALLLVEAVGGCYDFDSNTCSATAASCLVNSTSSLSLDPKEEASAPFNTVSMEMEPTEADASVEGGVFSFEAAEEAALTDQSTEEPTFQVSAAPSRNSTKVPTPYLPAHFNYLNIWIIWIKLTLLVDCYLV